MKCLRELVPAPLPAAVRCFWIESTVLLKFLSAAFPPDDLRDADGERRAVLLRADELRADERAVVFRPVDARARELPLRDEVVLRVVPAVLRVADRRAAGDISLLSLGGGGDVYFTRRMATQPICTVRTLCQ